MQVITIESKGSTHRVLYKGAMVLQTQFMAVAELVAQRLGDCIEYNGDCMGTEEREAAQEVQAYFS